MADCQDIIRQRAIQYGYIYTVAGQYSHPVIKVAGEIPKDILQQLRNAWSCNF